MGNTEFLFRGAFKSNGGNFLAGLMPNENEMTPSAIKKVVAAKLGLKEEDLEQHLKDFLDLMLKIWIIHNILPKILCQ